MTNPTETKATQATAAAAPADNSKELNFKKQTEYYEGVLQEERKKRLELEQAVKSMSPKIQNEEEEEDDEPYVDRKKLDKTLNRFANKSREETRTEIQKAVSDALSVERQNTWLKSHPDFYEVMQHAQAFADKNPDLAEDYLDLEAADFKKQKMVYNNIKAMGLHKKEEPKPSIQDQIKDNKKGYFYAPSGQGTPPYQPFIAGGKEYSQDEQKAAFHRMRQLQEKLRVG